MQSDVGKEVREETGRSGDSKHPVDAVRSQKEEMEREKYENLRGQQKELKVRFNHIKGEKMIVDAFDQKIRDTVNSSYLRLIQNNPAFLDLAQYSQEMPPELLGRQAQAFIGWVNTQYRGFEARIEKYGKARENYISDANQHNIGINKHNSASSERYRLERFDVEGHYSVDPFDHSTSPSMSNKRIYLLQR